MKILHFSLIDHLFLVGGAPLIEKLVFLSDLGTLDLWVQQTELGFLLDLRWCCDDPHSFRYPLVSATDRPRCPGLLSAPCGPQKEPACIARPEMLCAALTSLSLTDPHLALIRHVPTQRETLSSWLVPLPAGPAAPHSVLHLMVSPPSQLVELFKQANHILPWRPRAPHPSVSKCVLSTASVGFLCSQVQPRMALCRVQCLPPGCWIFQQQAP
ncbi:uncharacterized protein LOC122237425 isoform X1 [Panthera tigris]|uniref:uncharacterized protein LOC122237425 isoform X1 n=1 Tax=Panthera tigris TaxID=9694 RepID=UPI001C6F6BB5|nr:uncharacterized protein LOC122237425 isoform X1 [Panthera tigris]XP_042838365.1 uncharacterized protein LOC122237425 isoform X1 [Panthera tigris]